MNVLELIFHFRIRHNLTRGQKTNFMERLRFGIHFLFHPNTWVTNMIDEYWYDVHTVQKLNQFVDTFNCGTILKHYADNRCHHVKDNRWISWNWFFISEFVITWHVSNRRTSWNVYVSEFIFYSTTIHGWQNWSTNFDMMYRQCKSLISLSTHSTVEVLWNFMQRYSKTKAIWSSF